MKKVYIKPEISTEIIEVELPISASAGSDMLPVHGGESDRVIGEEGFGFLGKDRDNSDWGGLW